ncbi:MAG: hypothetical protein KTR22_05070 [Flavobacteriaceae bacterium]|nr:hypothetical protein [Flavobacteriaceae bacterium]
MKTKAYSIFLTTFFLLLATIGVSQNPYEAQITNDSRAMGKAFISQEYKSLAEYTYPLVVEMVGGKDGMIAILGDTMGKMKEQGLEFSKIEFGKPSQVHPAGDELHCLLLQTLHLKTPNGTVISNSYLLGISQNQGKKWYFLDVADLTNETVYEMFPEYNSELVIPAKQEPQFIPN